MFCVKLEDSLSILVMRHRETRHKVGVGNRRGFLVKSQCFQMLTLFTFFNPFVHRLLWTECELVCMNSRLASFYHRSKLKEKKNMLADDVPPKSSDHESIQKWIILEGDKRRVVG